MVNKKCKYYYLNLPSQALKGTRYRVGARVRLNKE